MLMPRTYVLPQVSPVTPPLLQILVLLAGRSARETTRELVEFHAPMYADGPEEVWITSVSRACERLPLQMVPSVAPLSWATQVPRPQCHAVVMPLVVPEKTETPVEQT